ncbi:MAG TPA: hypothetical protein VH682_01550 [Gemmataceae bacterium]
MTPVLRYVLDENLRGVLWHAIQQHNNQSAFPFDVVRVGDPPDLPQGSADPDILIWAEREGRILVSLDKKTLSGHLAQHLQQGHHSPGIFIMIPSSTLPAIPDYLMHAAYAGDPLDYADGIRFIP